MNNEKWVLEQTRQYRTLCHEGKGGNVEHRVLWSLQKRRQFQNMEVNGCTGGHRVAL